MDADLHQQRWEGQPLLCQLAGEEGIYAAELAELAGLSKQTVSRYWSEPTWLAKIGAEHLLALARVLPAVTNYLTALPTSSLQQAISELDAAGVSVRRDRIRSLLEQGAHPAHVAAALRAGSRLLACGSDEDLVEQCGYIALFWERQRGRCFEHVLGVDPDATLILDGGQVLAQAARMLDLLMGMRAPKGPVRKQDRARQVLIHYLSLQGTVSDTAAISSPREHAKALDLRCQVMSRLIRENDVDLYIWYKNRVNSDSLARMTESWMFPAWNGDIPSVGGPFTPRGIVLTRSARELMHEMVAPKYSDAYLCYVWGVYVPIALAVDSTLGGRRTELIQTAKERFLERPPSQHLASAVAKVDKR